jgi:hypothetical protein
MAASRSLFLFFAATIHQRRSNCHRAESTRDKADQEGVGERAGMPVPPRTMSTIAVAKVEPPVRTRPAEGLVDREVDRRHD